MEDMELRKPEDKELKAIKEWWAKVDTGCDDPGDVASKGMDDVPVLFAHIETLQQRLALSEAAGASMVDVLRKHWITAIECDHKAKTDTVRCSCSIWTGTPQASVGFAVEQWVQHIQALSSSHGKAALEVLRAAEEYADRFDQPKFLVDAVEKYRKGAK